MSPSWLTRHPSTAKEREGNREDVVSSGGSSQPGTVEKAGGQSAGGEGGGQACYSHICMWEDE